MKLNQLAEGEFQRKSVVEKVMTFFFPVAQQPKMGLGLLIVDVSSSLTDIHTHTHTHIYIYTHTHTYTPDRSPLNQ
jgi:hypothetical protein